MGRRMEYGKEWRHRMPRQIQDCRIRSNDFGKGKERLNPLEIEKSLIKIFSYGTQTDQGYQS